MKIQFTPAARLDVVEAHDWYEIRAPLALNSRPKSIANWRAFQFPIMHADIRRARLRQFPYSLFFRSLGEEIFVVACFHASRDPRRWEGRV